MARGARLRAGAPGLPAGTRVHVPHRLPGGAPSVSPASRRARPAPATPLSPLIVLIRCLLFRVESGAGLIKLRGDPCWRDLTCLYSHHETQPMPNPLSWYFHHLPKRLHRVEVLGNHFAQLVVPFFLFFPQPIAGVAGLVILATQSWLILSGNFSWLNVLTMTLAVAILDDAALRRVFPVAP